MSEQLKSPEASHENAIVGIGSVVEIQYIGESEEESETIKIIGWHNEGKDDTVLQTVSPSSPLGTAIIGKERGDVITYLAPGNNAISIKILSIRSS